MLKSKIKYNLFTEKAGNWVILCTGNPVCDPELWVLPKSQVSSSKHEWLELLQRKCQVDNGSLPRDEVASGIYYNVLDNYI